MTTSALRSALLWLVPVTAVCALGATESSQSQSAAEAQESEKKAAQVYFLEIVTPDVDAKCNVLEKVHGVKFGKPVLEFGNARTAPLHGGGKISVRAPMRATEEPIVRPYLLVDDIEAAVKAAKAAGSEIAFPPMEIPKRGKFAIYIHGGIEHGLWEN